MKFTLAAAATVLLASQASATLTTTVDELRTDFASHIKTHNKVYDSAEYEIRFQQYRKNKQFVDAHNANAIVGVLRRRARVGERKIAHEELEEC